MLESDTGMCSLDLRSSNQDDPDIEEDIRNIVKNRFDDGDGVDDSDINIFYEHGQWWVTIEAEEGPRTFSVVDCESETGEEYLDLEEV